MIASNTKNFFSKLLDLCNNTTKDIVISSHTNVDIDGFASAIFLSRILRSINSSFKDKISVVIPSMNKLTMKIAKEFDFSNYKKEFPEEIGICILVDTSNPMITDLPKDLFHDFYKGSTIKNFKEKGEIIPEKKEKESKINHIVLLDHHSKQKIDLNFKHKQKALIYINPDYASASEIITTIYMENKKKISLEQILSDKEKYRLHSLLLMGIMTDTGNLKYADNKTLKLVNFILEVQSNIDLWEIKKLLITEKPRLERIAQLKAAMRVQNLHYFNDWIVVFSHVSSFGASASKSLVRLGASLSFVVSFTNKEKKEFHISSRAKSKILAETNIDLGKIMESVGIKFNGSGGGHRGAAGCHGKTKKKKDIESIERKILSELRAFFSNQKK